MAREYDIPASRTRRLLHLGKLAGGLAGGAMAEGLRRVSSGELPAAADLLLTPGNARRLAGRLSEMRGAAMKVGQLLSMEAGDFLPREFTDILARLRDDAHAMPMLQVNAQLERAWGADWLDGFERFFFQPIAAASIGQVHKAITRDGRTLAIKIQYPGIRDSIDSDVDNVAGLLKLFRIIPDPDAFNELLREARRQLHEEADYLSEAAYIEAYRERVNGFPGVRIPRVDADLTRADVLAMEFISGEPVDTLAAAGLEKRNAIATRLIDLVLHEILDWGLVQTDPNFSNYLYLSDCGDLGLLDFGATRRFAPDRPALFRRLLAAALRGDRAALLDAAAAVGYLGDGDAARYRDTMVTLLEAAAEPARHVGAYDFGTSSLARRMSEQVIELRMESRLWRMPPPEILFLHRKIGGMYLLCTHLKAAVDVGRLIEPHLAAATAP